MTLSWQHEAQDGAARAGVLHTAHGEVPTPVFMPVGTAGTVKAMTADAVRATGARMVLGNTYHLMLRPGAERIARLGGLHRFMDWHGPILTDSGGFQVMSLSGLRKMDADGVTFQSHVDGSRHRLTPERSVEIQHLLGADVTMCFDECTPFPATHEQAATSMRLSMRWAARSRAGFEGYAVGGLAVGEGQEAMFTTLECTTPLLPTDKPRYLMGVGTPSDLIGAVRRGIDMFDCVMPTRSGRTGRAYTRGGVINIRNARHAEDNRPLDPACACPACRGHSRAYLHHLFKANEMLGPMLLTWHNIQYYQDLMAELRAGILAGDLAGTAARIEAGWQAEKENAA